MPLTEVKYSAIYVATFLRSRKNERLPCSGLDLSCGEHSYSSVEQKNPSLIMSPPRDGACGHSYCHFQMCDTARETETFSLSKPRLLLLLLKPVGGLSAQCSCSSLFHGTEGAELLPMPQSPFEPKVICNCLNIKYKAARTLPPLFRLSSYLPPALHPLGGRSCPRRR